MPLVLLVLGVVTTLAGLVLMASGLAVRDGTFDTEVLTPGTIATVGGLLLIGLAYIVRELRRIERTLAVRPMPLVARADHAVEASGTATPIRLPMPDIEPQVGGCRWPCRGAGRGHGARTLPRQAADDPARRKRPARGGGRRIARAARSSRFGGRRRGRQKRGRCRSCLERRRIRSLRTADRCQGAPGDVICQREGFGVQHLLARGAAPEGHAARRRVPGLLRRRSSAMRWRRPRRLRLYLYPTRLRGASAISVLKSGVVEGMAYTLYSDGSIEAQLPQGTLRFGSD